MDKLKQELKHLIKSIDDPSDLLSKVCECLCEKMEWCDWAGYYVVDPQGTNELVLGPYCGESTEHTHIGFGEGICGQAASTLKTFIVDDVSLESNYLSCSPEVKSEIVVPVFFEGDIVGEIDLDSHRKQGFDQEDRKVLEWLAESTAEALDNFRKNGSCQASL
ncbi:MAG: GAF domain-containing protein [Candidatus Aegiribacteria sp.]|nr:GAF domain-containing protein [Candidatus Aegiribacteria sp.]MBD3294326.1 GAF domain-containing protein [Candidatus Fermentibacteria bacterium]